MALKTVIRPIQEDLLVHHRVTLGITFTGTQEDRFYELNFAKAHARKEKRYAHLRPQGYSF